MPRTLRPGQRTRILIAGPELPAPEEVLVTADVLLEAPTWSRDGRCLVLNGDGKLFRLDLEAERDDPRRLAVVPFEGLPPINNDHVLDPDGEHVLMTADDGHIYRGALAGGAVRRLTPEDGAWHFLHGISPDGGTLAYVELRSFEEAGRVVLLDASGTAAPRPLTTALGHIDGPEWTPDGAHLVVNAEGWDDVPGHAQLTVLDPDGDKPPRRMAASGTVDWFPHPSPDGRWVTWISFPAGTRGHPEDLDVVVRLAPVAEWTRPLPAAVGEFPVPGGQGTINVNSWAPDSRRFAFVAYPFS